MTSICERKEVAANPEVKIRLTIAIPTYNRNEILKSNLAKLIPQLNSSCELLILDNCSDELVECKLTDIISAAKNQRIRIIRHRANVGGNENILRCIEHAEGEFVWLLGDDDQPIASAITNIFQDLDEYPDALVFNMYAPCPMHSLRTKTELVRGSVGYLTSANFLGELIFISGMILKVSNALHNMAAAHLWQSSHSPQLIVAAMMLRPDNIAVISAREVVLHGGITTPIESQGSVIPIALGFPNLLLAPWNHIEAKHIMYLLKSARQGWITPKGVMNQLVSLANNEGSKGRGVALRYYYLLRRNFFSIGGVLSLGWILFTCSWPLVAWPKLGQFIRNSVFRLFKGTQYKNNNGVQDIHR